MGPLPVLRVVDIEALPRLLKLRPEGVSVDPDDQPGGGFSVGGRTLELDEVRTGCCDNGDGFMVLVAWVDSVGRVEAL